MTIVIATNLPAGPVVSLADLGDGEAEAGTGNRRYLCPLCSPERRKSRKRDLSANLATGAWQCWHCEAKGKLTDFWTERPKLSRKEQIRERVQKAFSLPPRVDPEHDPDDAEWRRWLTAAVPLAGTRGAAYLEGRGIPPDFAARHGVTYIRQWYGRPGIVYPLCDQAGKLAAVGVRYVDGGDDPKTRTGGRLLLGAFVVPGAFDGESVVIVEGPADALALALCGVSAVALHRTSAPAWVLRACAFKRVLVALDADDGGEKGVAQITPLLSAYGATVERLRPPAGKDWNDTLQASGVPALRRFIFDALAAPLWARAFRLHQRAPHATLEAAIDAADWSAFPSELRAYALPTVATAAPSPVQVEMNV